ncbi:hypothetical protein LMG22037_04980 [Paraburkholderia phenoliruptrix]|uniref:DUF3717 domain-containing protein n=1 Tax=Paraburkholderia phenoliruptrix TaxID=252970 RepID=A0A6J5C2U3_9BURK|nr:DUF3717 domain-containing protein [Paraburkholderia phenoliruptrix]CAB3723615.1 hypothetical protein LMG22037_04980 [Paraburkholderia phenoliruptrix]
MRSFTLAQIERAIHHWRKHHDRARLYNDSVDGAREERLLSTLYGRLVEKHLGAIDIDQISRAEFAALGCLFDAPPADPER